MSRILTIGSALLDFYVKSPGFDLQTQPDGGVLLCQSYGAKLEMDDYVLTAGGGAHNAAVALARLGHEVAILTELGHDFLADFILAELKKEQIETQFVVQERLEKTGASVILVGEDGGRTVIVDRGASALLDGYDIPAARLTDFEWLHFTSVNGNLPVVEKVLSLVSVRQLGFSWNPGQGELKQLAAGQIRLPDFFRPAIFLVNNEEWQLVTDQQEEIMAKFTLVVVTNGTAGGTVYQPGQPPYQYPASPQNKRVDDTGAGDAFGSSLVAALLTGQDIMTAVQWGIKNAGSVVGHYGAKAGLLTLSELEDKLHE